ncbi:glycosyltransferase [Myxococcus faecalis]|uniref:glycosyltransferase family 4 protein n=1 Tax=Myxococcus faecalis TaxID=3115646 RepID=UPI003CE8D8B5
MSDLPRLLLCSFDVIPGPSGSSRRLTEYLKALPDRFSVVVLSAKTPDHSHIEKYQGARLLRVPVGSGDLASRIQAFERAVRRQLESEDYALAHFTDPFGGYALCELKGDYGYRLIYEAQTFPSQELRYTHPQTEGDRRFLSKVRRQELFCLMNADRIITGSETTRSYIQSLGASEELIRVVRAPVDLGPFSPDVLGAPDGEPLRLMYLGSHVGWQGLPTLLRAVALAAKQVEVRLTLVGAQHPDWQPHLDELVKELGLKDQVEFQPPVHHDDVAKVLALADVGVLALDDVERNRLQGGPLAKVSEYCAAGRPIIAADLPVCRELIPADAAVFFPVGDSQAMAARIVELARDVPRRIELGQRAREHAESALDAGVIRGQLLDIYDSLLDKRSVPVSGRSEDDLPAATMVTGTPTSRLASLLPPDSGRIKIPQPAKRDPVEEKPAEPPSEVAAEEPPVVMGMVLEDGFDTRLIKTEPDARPIEPPVVMGLPLRERAAQTSTPGAASSTSAPTTSEPTPVTAQGIPPDPTPVTPRRTTEPEEPEQDAPEASPRREEDAAEERLSKVPPHGTPRLGDEPPAPTPVESQSARFPDESREEPGGKEARDERAEEPPSPTPVVRAPAPLPMDEPPSPTPIIRMPASLKDDRGAMARDGGAYSNGRHSTREEPPSPTPVVRAPAPLPFDEPPSPTPIVKAPAPLPFDEPPSPTPIVRSPLASRAEDDAPAPTPIIPARSVLASRSTSARVETPSRRMAPLTPQTKGSPDGDRGSTRVDSERPSVRGAPVPDPERPAGRAGATTDSEPPSVRGTPLPDAERPSVRGTPVPEPERPSGRTPTVPEPERASVRVPNPDSERPSVRSALPELTARGHTTDPERNTPRPSGIVEPERPRTGETDRLPPLVRPSPPPDLSRSGSRGSALDPDRPPPILTPGAGTPSVGKSSLLGDLPPPDTDRGPPVLSPSSDADRPPSLPPRATSAPPPVPRQRPPRLLSIDGPPRLEPVDTSASRPGLPAIRSPEAEDEPEEISEDEAHAIEDGEEAGPTPPHSRPRLDDEPDEISSDEVEDAEVSASSAAQLVDDEDDLQEADADPIPDEDEGPPPEPLSSTLNPWFAQLAHGYCPPEGTQFARHTPPTTFPGRDDDADPSRTPSAPRAPGVVRGKSS